MINATDYLRENIIAAITKGITTSFANTPQAKNDRFTGPGLTEDSGIQYLDVMANDSGGNAKTLYSLDDGISAGGGSPSDLLEKDDVGSVNYSALGAHIWITADGKVAYDAGPIQAQFQSLAAGEYATDSFTYAIRLGNGALSWATATVQIAGTNDAPVAVDDTNAGDAVIESGVNPGNTPFAGDATAAGNVLTNDSDVDAGATKTVSAVNGIAGNVGMTITGTYGSVVIGSNGDYTYTLDNANIDTNALAQGASASDVFSYAVSDQFDAISTATLTINITGTNDAPVIAEGPQTGAVQEDGLQTAGGQLTATDVDHNALLRWSVSGGAGGSSTVSYQADYLYQLDNLKITKNGNAFLEDGFGDGVAPPSSPSFSGGAPHTYGTNGVFSESGGRLIMDGYFAGPALGVGTPDPFVGHFATVRSNIDPTDLARGLKSDDDFTVEARYDLLMPAEGRQAYGIRLTDRVLSGPQSNAGDDRVEVVVQRGLDGVMRVRLQDDDVVADHVTVLQSFALNAQAGEDQIVLRLAHDDASAGVVRASFDVLDDGSVTRTVNFSATGRIFGTDTAGTADDENWTMAQTVGWSPALTGGTIGGVYGSLNVDTDGTWTYNLNNGAANVQALAAGQTVSDTFTVRVADEYGASDSQTVTVTVNGTNDAPVANTDNLILVGSGDTLTATGPDGAFVLARVADATNPIVGTWYKTGGGEANSTVAITFLADGTYLMAEDGDSIADPSGQDGMERGTYTWNSSTGAFTHVTTVNTNGEWGLSHAVIDGAQINGDTLTVTGEEGSFSFARVASATNPIVGTWYAPGGGEANSATAITFLADGTYLLAEDGDSVADPSGQDGMERGTYTWDSSTGAFTHVTTVNTNGQWGLSHSTVDDVHISTSGQGLANEDTPVQIAAATLLANDTDVDAGDTKTLVSVQTPSHGTVSLSAGTVTFTPDLNYNGPASFTYTMQDATGAPSTASANFTVNPVNDAPVLQNTYLGPVGEDQWTGIIPSGYFAINDKIFDPDGDALTYSFSEPSVPEIFTIGPDSLSITPGAAFQYLSQGETAVATINVTATDSHGAQTTGPLTWTVVGANDAPVIGGQTSGSVSEDGITSTSGTLTISDPDAGQSSFQVQSGLAGAYGTLNINAAGGWTYFLNNSLPAVQALNSGQTLADTVNIHTADGTTQAIGITINGLNELAGNFLAKQLTYQYLFSTISSPYASALPFTTGAGIEVAVANGPYYAGTFQVDVSASSILITHVAPASYNGLVYNPSVTFNGFKITDALNNVRDITGVLDNSTKAVTTFDANNVFVNWQSQSFVTGETILIDVTFGSTGNDPIVFDLNGDGVQFATGMHAVNFNLDVNGDAELIAWASPEDGVLVMDLDHSGAIEDGKEVLSESFAGFGFGNSMEALRSLDTNVDGIVNAGDGQFADLRVWRDANGDGVSQAGELLSLGDLGIAGISVQEEARDETIDGQQIYAAGTFLYANGATGSYVGVHLSPPSLAETEASVAASGDPADYSLGGMILVDGIGNDVITDFTLGTGGNVINLHDVLSTFAGVTADTHANAFYDGYLRFAQSGADTLVQVDSDGGGNSFVTMATLQNVLLLQTDVSNFVL